MAEPRISVIIPYFNAGRFIEGALASVRLQEYAPLEIILIDDGSSDDIAQRIKMLGTDIVFLQQENKGPAAARNLGIRHATGEIIAFLDADDRWPEGKLALQVARMQQDPSLGLVNGLTACVKLEGATERPVRFPESGGQGKLYAYLGAALVRRFVFDEVGLFDETMTFHEDQDWYLRVRERRIKLAIIREVTLIYQLHGGNMTNSMDLRNTRYLQMLKRSIDRRKAQTGGEAANLPPLPVGMTD